MHKEVYAQIYLPAPPAAVPRFGATAHETEFKRARVQADTAMHKQAYLQLPQKRHVLVQPSRPRALALLGDLLQSTAMQQAGGMLGRADVAHKHAAEFHAQQAHARMHSNVNVCAQHTHNQCTPGQGQKSGRYPAC